MAAWNAASSASTTGTLDSAHSLSRRQACMHIALRPTIGEPTQSVENSDSNLSLIIAGLWASSHLRRNSRRAMRTKHTITGRCVWHY